MSDVQELKTVADQFAAKYGKPYAQVQLSKNIEDRNCLKPVYGKYVLSQLASQFLPNLPDGRGHSPGGGGVWGVCLLGVFERLVSVNLTTVLSSR